MLRNLLSFGVLSYSIIGNTQDFESCIPGSTPGGTIKHGLA